MTEPAVTLRRTTPTDLSRVVAWERAPENAAFIEAWPVERHRAALSDPHVRHLVIEAEGRPVGFVILVGVGEPEPLVELRRIVVAEKGRGHGRSAVEWVIREAFDAWGAGEVWLDVVPGNGRAKHVYERCGFNVDPSAELWADIDGVRTRLVKMAIVREGPVGDA